MAALQQALSGVDHLYLNKTVGRIGTEGGTEGGRGRGREGRKGGRKRRITRFAFCKNANEMFRLDNPQMINGICQRTQSVSTDSDK